MAQATFWNLDDDKPVESIRHRNPTQYTTIDNSRLDVPPAITQAVDSKGGYIYGLETFDRIEKPDFEPAAFPQPCRCHVGYSNVPIKIQQQLVYTGQKYQKPATIQQKVHPNGGYDYAPPPYRA